ncbi:glycosyltransferase family 39 protein [Chloroflexi bacterium TSY]|nr:glycosyltransferase family 39 protein [Chloroflexi bacterium TSY]
MSKRHDSLSSNHAVLILLCAIIALATFLRLYHLGMESFSYDEGIMIDATGNDFEEVLVNIKRGRPPVLVIFGYLWVRIFGSTEAAVRGLSALAGILSVPLLFFLGRALFESRVGLLGALLLSVSLFHIYYSQDYRYYGLLALLTLFYIFFYVQLLNSAPQTVAPQKSVTQHLSRQRGNKTLVGYTIFGMVISGILLYYTHYQGAFILGAAGFHFLFRWAWHIRRNRLGTKRGMFQNQESLNRAWTSKIPFLWMLSQLAIIVGLSPSLYKIWNDYTVGVTTGNFRGSLGAMGTLGPLSEPPVWMPIHTLFVSYLFVTIDNILNWTYLPVSVGLLVLGTFVYAQRQGSATWIDSLDKLGARVYSYVVFWKMSRSLHQRADSWPLLFFWIACPIFLPFILSKLLGPMYLPRYTIGALPAFCLAIGAFATRIRRVVPEFATIGALLILIIPGLQSYYADSVKETWPIAAAYISEHAQSNDTLVFVSFNLVFVSFNNEPASRIQSVFGRYYQGNLPQCTVNAGQLADPIPGSEQTADEQLQVCIPNQRLWLVTRTTRGSLPGVINSSFLDPTKSMWSIQDEQEYVGVMVHLVEQQSDIGAAKE